MSESLRLYSYWRSSAAYRVRIGLNLKGLTYETVPVHLVRGGGEQHRDTYRATNPQELVPVLQHGGRRLRQSLAILEYLDEVWVDAPALLPRTARSRARVRALAQLVACDIHPLNNLRVTQYLERQCSLSEEQRNTWVQHWIVEGLRAFEALLIEDLSRGEFCEGDKPTIADCCLIPQLYNARRFKVDLAPFPAIRQVEETCLALPAFADAQPERQPDAGQV